MTCPASHALEQFLSGSHPDAPGVEAHLKTCPGCRDVLDRLSDNADLRQWVPRALSLPDLLEKDTALLSVVQKLETSIEGSAPTKALPEVECAWRAGSTLGCYCIEGEIGRGGMGLVLRAYDKILGRTVAVKVLRSGEVDERSRARLVHEAQLAARLRHDNVVTVHAVVDLPDEPPCLVMEYVEGSTLTALIRSKGRLEPRAAADILIQMARGLEAAHTAGLIHRDIKPSNVLVDASTGRAKITDFGLARWGERASGLTQEGVLAGTPTYMSPEQARGAADLDCRSDIYSLGVTLYEALTGEVPFRGAPHLVLQQILSEDPRPPRLFQDAIPRDLETVCQKAMAKEPGQRYPTARAFGEDLERWQRGEPILARPVGKLERGWRWCRRNRRLATLTTTVLTLLLVVAIGSTVAAIVIAREQSRTENERAAAVEARERADRSTAAAQEHFSLALSTLHTLISKVQQQLGERTGTLQLRQQLTETALKDLERIARSAEATPEADLNLVLAHDRLGDLFFSLGKTPQARREYEHSRDLADSLVSAGNTEFDVRRGLAAALDKIGNLDRYAGNWQSAAESHRRAVAIRQSLVRDAPENSLFRRDLAVSHNKVGELSLAAGDAVTALAYYQQGLQETQEAGPAGDPARFQNDLGFSYKRLGDASVSLWDLRETESYYREALAAYAVWNDPASPQWQLQVNTIYARLGQVNLHLADYPTAETWFRKSFAGYEAQAHAEPANLEAQRNLAGAYHALGDRARCAGDYVLARDLYSKSLAIDRDLVSRDPGSRQRHGDLLEQLADLTDNEVRAQRYADAAHWLEQARAAFVPLEKLGPLLPAFQRAKKDCLHYMVVFAGAAVGLDDLRGLLGKSSEIVPDLLQVRALGLARSGQVRKAVDSVEEFRKRSPGSALNHHAIARIYALCAQSTSPADAMRKLYTGKALEAFGEALRQAPELGQGQPLQPDFAVLRDEPQFKSAIRQANSGTPAHPSL
jgi:tetratricopeptide (TPR) repeat protein